MKIPKNKNPYLLYTCLFILLLPIVFYPFLASGKSFVWNMDGIDQHFPMLNYYGELLRGLLSGKGFPMVDFKVGLGFDTITTLQYYVLGDPIALLSVFINPKNNVFVYNILILIRFYLAGISFIVFVRYWKKDGMSVVLGALIYVFCGYAFYAGVRHPFFMNPMIYLPLLMVGLEQVLRRKKPFLLVIMAFVCTISNFYFFYVLTVIAVIYVIFRYFYIYRKDFKSTIQGLLLTGLRTGGYYLLGVAMAAFIFLPVIYAFLQNGRMNNKPKLVTGYFLYSSKYYLSLIKGMFASGISPSYWVLLTFSSVTLVSLVILFCNKKYRQLRYVLLLAFIGLLVPSFGYFMNGFAYLANRWCFLLSFLVAMAFTMTYEKLFELNGQERIILIFAVAAYGLVTLIGTKQSAARIEFYILLAVTIIIEILQLRWFNSKRLLSELIICVMVFATVGFHGYAYYSKNYHGYVSEFLTKAEIDKSTTKGEFSVVSDIKDPSFYRIETHGKSALNESMVIGFNDVSAYFSLMTGDVTNFFKELELLKQVSAYRFDGMDNRTVLDEIQSVKYYITTNQKSVPYGYKLMKTVNAGTSSYYLYQNLFALPLGYTYENYMLLSDFNKLSSLEMQNALMNAVVINSDSNYANKTNQDMSAGIQKLDVKITPDQNVVMGPGSIDIKKAGATITLTFNAVPNSETYIRLGNFNMNEKKVASTTFTATGNNGAKKNVNVRSVYYNSYFGKVNYLVNMGYTDTGLTTVTLTFPGKDTYSYSSIEVYSQAMNNYDTQAAALGKSVLDNVKVGNNNVQGDITLNNKGIMALSIPYSKGWKAYVDGKKADLLNANVMYMALPLDAGQHHIVLKYVTPLLIPGSLISLAAFGYFIWMLIFNRRVKRD